jgi:hypothetical protein
MIVKFFLFADAAVIGEEVNDRRLLLVRTSRASRILLMTSATLFDKHFHRFPRFNATHWAFPVTSHHNLRASRTDADVAARHEDVRALIVHAHDAR